MSEKDSQQVVDLIYILDESGSMEEMGKEPIQGVNAMIEEQKKTLNDGATFTLIKFNDRVNYVYDDVPLEDVPVFTEESYRPNNATALFDAIGTAITTKSAKKKNRNVIVVVMTDGQENASRKFRSGEQIKKMVEKVEKELNWKFVYLAANQDAFASGARIGISSCAGYDYTLEGYRSVCQRTNAAVSSYRQVSHETGQSPASLEVASNEAGRRRVNVYPFTSPRQ